MGIPLQARAADGNEETRFLWDFVEGGAVTVEQGSARVTRTDNELFIEVANSRYRALLES